MELPAIEQAHPLLVSRLLASSIRSLKRSVRAYSFYKNIALYMTGFWVRCYHHSCLSALAHPSSLSQFAFQNSFSGQVLEEGWTLTFYNVLFTVLPPVVLGVFDQFVGARMLDRYPELYKLGQQNKFVSVKLSIREE